MKSKYATIPSLWAMACAAALAQQTPPPAENKPAEEEKPAPNVPHLQIGYGSWGLRGNERTFRRYATLPNGLFIKELSYGFYQASPGMFGEFVFRGEPMGDYVGEVSATVGNGSKFRASFDNADFMVPSVSDIDESRRRNFEGDFYHSLGNVDLSLNFASRQLDKAFEGPAFSVHTRTERWGGRAATQFGKEGQVAVSMTDRRFFDRTSFQPDSHAQTWQGSVLHPFGPLDVEASYAQTTIEQDGRRDSKVKVWNLDGGLPLGQDFDLQFGFRSQKYELPNVANAYVRERFTSYARVVGAMGRVSGNLGWKHVETERLREDHSFVDVPKFNTLDGRLSGNFGTGPRWSIKGTWTNLDGDATMLTSDPRRLFWDDNARLRFQLDHGGSDWGAYAAYMLGFMENERRDITIRTNGFVVGGTYQWRPNVDFFSEVTWDNARTSFTEPEATLGFDSFFPSSRVLTLGGNWAISPTTSLTTSFTEMVTDNDNPIFDPLGNIYGKFISLGATHRTREGYELGLMIAPMRFADRAIRPMGYEATVVQLTARGKF